MKRLAGAALSACWARPLALVEAGNTRGTGESGAGLAMPEDWPEIDSAAPFYVKRQQRFYCHPAWNLFLPTPTLRRELRALLFAHAHGVPVPQVLAYGEGAGGRAVLALAAIAPALDLQAALDAAPTSRDALLGEVGNVLAHMHAQRLRHGALYPKHILVRQHAAVGARVALIDLEKARRPLRAARCITEDLAQLLRRAPFLTASDRGVLAEAYARAGLPAGAQVLRAGPAARAD